MKLTYKDFIKSLNEMENKEHLPIRVLLFDEVVKSFEDMIRITNYYDLQLIFSSFVWPSRSVAKLLSLSFDRGSPLVFPNELR